MVIVAGAARQHARQLSRHERTNLRQKFHCFRRITAQGVSFETVDAHLDEIAQKVNGVSQDYATAAIAFLISPQSARYFSTIWWRHVWSLRFEPFGALNSTMIVFARFPFASG